MEKLFFAMIVKILLLITLTIAFGILWLCTEADDLSHRDGFRPTVLSTSK
jgi:hypothetical protein